MTCYDEWHHLVAPFGKIGFNSNVANLMTGVFIATGQDVAAVDSSHCIFSLSQERGKLLVHNLVVVAYDMCGVGFCRVSNHIVVGSCLG